MSLVVPRRKHDDPPKPAVNEDVAHELAAAAAKSFTGVLEVADKPTKARARLYLYEGGLYSIEIDGYAPRVFARLLSSGILDTRTSQDLALLTGLDASDPQAGAHAVESGWVTIDALANIHQELLLASLGGVLLAAKAKIHPRKGVTSSHFCTLPLPVDPLFDIVRMRADRLQGTWSMLGSGLAPGAAVLRRTGVPLAGNATTSELLAMGREIDGLRSVDEVAWGLGFTRAEAVHLTSMLVRSGVAAMTDAEPAAAMAHHYRVPEEFAAHRLAEAPVTPPLAEAPVVPALGLAAARVVVVEQEHALEEAVRAEQEASSRVAEVAERLRRAREDLAALESFGGAPLRLA